MAVEFKPDIVRCDKINSIATEVREALIYFKHLLSQVLNKMRTDISEDETKQLKEMVDTLEKDYEEMHSHRVIVAEEWLLKQSIYLGYRRTLSNMIDANKNEVLCECNFHLLYVSFTIKDYIDYVEHLEKEKESQ